MKSFTLHAKVPRGSLLVGGYTPVPVGLDASHAQGTRARRAGGPVEDDVPLIPASALRGALRESLEAILRGAGRAACARGTGRDPLEDRPAKKDEATSEAAGCTRGENGGPCIACQLFGTPALHVGARGCFAALHLGDAVKTTALDAWSVRHGVGIDRARRSAKEKVLYDARIPAPGDDLEFLAEGRLLDDELEPYLEAAVAATKHVGARKSRGLGRVELTLTMVDAPARKLSVDADAVEIRVRLRTPAMVGGHQIHPSLRVTRAEVPGSVLRGAVGFALARALGSEATDPAFTDLVHEQSGARFGFLHPRAPSGGDRSKVALTDEAAKRFAVVPESSPEPWPITARACKTAGVRHGVSDLLLLRIAAALVETPEAAERVRERVREVCPACEGALKAAPGNRSWPERPGTRTVTRVSIDRPTGTARSGALFSHEVLEAGVELTGRITGIPKPSRARLAEALGLPLSIGRGVSLGWGALEVEKVVRAPDAPDVKRRARAFAETLAKLFAALELDVERARRLVSLTLLSPLVPSERETSDDFGEPDLLEGFPEGTSVHLRLRRFTIVGRWDQRAGQEPPRQAVEAGAVFVLEVPGPVADSEAVLTRLRALEAEGAGVWTRMGYGALRSFDPVHVDRRLHED